LVKEDAADSEGDGRNDRPSSPLRYGEKFEELCGYYLSIGMSYQDYWDGDNCMAKYYRDKYEREAERKNYFLWLQGGYVYEAILDASPVLNPFSKRDKPLPYRSEPMPITVAQSKFAKERENNRKLQSGKEAMRAIMIDFNKRFEQKQKEEGGIDDGS